MIIGYHDFELKENFALGENLSLKEISDMFKTEAVDDVDFRKHNFEAIIIDPDKYIDHFKNLDVVVSLVGSLSWYYYQMREKNKLDFKIVHFVHTTFFCTYLLQETIVSDFIRTDDLVVFVSEFQRQLFINHFEHLDEENTAVCFPLLDNIKPLSRKAGKHNINAINLGFLGDFSRAKGFHYVLQSFAELKKNNDKKYRLVIAGRESDYNESDIKTFFAVNNIRDDEIEILSLNNIPYFELDKFWNQIDVLLFPSVCDEPLGRVVLEASLKGIPVISPAVGGVSEFLDEESLLKIKPLIGEYTSKEVKDHYIIDLPEMVDKIRNHDQIMIPKIPDFETRKKDLFDLILKAKKKEIQKLNPEIAKIIQNSIIFLDKDIDQRSILNLSLEFLKELKEPFLPYNAGFELCKKLDFFPKFYFRRKKALIVSPHIDDAFLFCGEQIFELKEEGYDVEIVNVFAGRPARFNELAQKFRAKYEVDPDPQKRINEEEKIGDKFDLKIRNMNYLDGVFISDSEQELFSENIREDDLVELKNKILFGDYEKVFFPAGYKKHIDHITVADFLKNIYGKAKTEFYYYRDCYTDNFHSEFFNLVKQNCKLTLAEPKKRFLEQKKEALRFYKSQKSIVDEELNSLAETKEEVWKVESINNSKIPELVIIEVTQKCNLDCVMCYNKGHERKENLGTDELKKFIIAIKALGVKMISFTGGEPFIRKDIFELINYANDLGIKTVVYTNGTLLSKQFNQIVESGLSQIFVSIDSYDSEKFKQIRGINADISLVKEGIKNLINERDKQKSNLKIRIATLIMQQNFKELLDIVEQSKKLGSDGITFKPVTIANPIFSTKNDSMIKPNPSKYKTFWIRPDQIPLFELILDQLAYLHEKEGFVYDTKEYFDTLKSYFRKPSNKDIGITCYKGDNYLVLDKDGYILPCWGMRPREKWNIKKEDIKKIWGSKIYESLRCIMESCNHPCTDMLEQRTFTR